LKNNSAADRLPRRANGKIQPLLLFLLGMGFLILGLRSIPAFIVVGVLFLFISYRGYTCRTSAVPEKE
jgi:hypothetical protein